MRRAFLAVGVVAVAVVVVLWLRRGKDEDEMRSTKAPTAGSAAVRTSTPRTPAKPASIRGTITRKTDGAAVGGAVIAIARAEITADLGSVETPTTVATSGASGAWEVAQIAPGDYIVAVTARGLLPSAPLRTTLRAGEEHTLDVVLEPGGTALRGTVSDVGGGPIANARVTAKLSEARLAATAELVALTGADGTYELTLGDGEFRVTAEHEDYTSARKSIEIAGAPQTLDFSLVPGAVIRGQVVARDTRKPVAGAHVRASGPRERFGATSAVSDAEGKFVLRGLSSGSTSITARARGYASVTPTVVQVGIGEEVEDVQVVVDGALSISGRVVKVGTQEGIAGARVGAFSMKGVQGDATDPSDDTGAFEIPGLRPGSYMLYAASEQTMLEIGQPVELVDKDVTDVIVELGAGVTLSGRVEPPAVATIALEMQGEVGLANMFQAIKTMLVRAESDASGAFKLERVPAGKFQIVAHTRDGNGGKLPVVVTDVDQQGLVVKLEKRASIAGRVIDSNGKPAPNIVISASPAETTGFRMSAIMDRPHRRSGPDGAFKIVGLEPGKYTVRTQDDFAFARFGEKDKVVTVELVAGQDKTGITLTVEARDGVIRGVVLGPDGKPAVDAWVSAHREQAGGDDREMQWRSRISTEPVLAGEGGKFTIANLYKGTYTLVADGPRGSSRGEKKGIKTGDSTTITLAALGTLVVTVTQRGAPVKEYDLACESSASDVERHAVTEDGAYTVENLAPADYTCKVEATSGTGEGKVSVPSGEAKLAVALAPFGSLTGVVVNVLTGQPVPDLSVIADADGGRGFIEAIAGRGVKTDASGRFVVERVPAGKGKLMLVGRDQGMTSIESREFVAKEGERVDLGRIEIVPPRTTDAGTFGMATEVKGDALEVTSVEPDKPAAQAGIVVGDKIVAIEGKPLAGVGDVAKKLLSSGIVGIGQTYRMTLERGPTVAVTSVRW